jgi:hypothetical protein
MRRPLGLAAAIMHRARERRNGEWWRLLRRIAAARVKD